MPNSIFSEVKVFPVDNGGKRLARGSFVVSNAVRVNFTLFDSAKGKFIMLPSEKDRNGKKDNEGKDIYYPHAQFISATARQEVQDEVIRIYNQQKETGDAGGEIADQDDLPF